MNLFKILIPKEKAQEITEIESFSVTWFVKTGWAKCCGYTMTIDHPDTW